MTWFSPGSHGGVRLPPLREPITQATRVIRGSLYGSCMGKNSGSVAKRERRARKGRLNAQEKAANTRAKYGPSMKPAPVTVRRVGQEPVERDQSSFAVRRYAPLLESAAVRAGFDSYAAYLVSDHWKALRLRVLKRDGHRCVLCRGDKNLQVHHDRYDSLGAEPLRILKTFCDLCHRRVHDH